MNQELSLGDAARVIQAEYGESFEAGLDQGKELLGKLLETKLAVPRSDADKLVEALIDAHTIRYEGKAGNLPSEQTGVLGLVAGRSETGTWYF